MNRTVKTIYVILLLAALALPSLSFLGVEEGWRKLCGAESVPEAPALTPGGFADRSFQNAFTERFSKLFFLRRTLFTTAMQLHDWANLGAFHYGYNRTLVDGKDGVLYEMPYVRFHMEHDRLTPDGRYAAVIAKLKELDDFCASIGADFVFVPMPDKPQVYPEYLPRWYRWFWDFDEYDVQGRLAGLCRAAGVKTLDGTAFMRGVKAKGEGWLYPPSGTHLTSLSCGRVTEELLRIVNGAGRTRIEPNPFLGVENRDTVWQNDEDIGRLLNLWFNPSLDAGVHLHPRFGRPEGVMNEGSCYFLGDCYRSEFKKYFRDARIFAPEKVEQSRRQGENPDRLKKLVPDLKLVALFFQSINTGTLYDRYEEIDGIVRALKRAYGEVTVKLPAEPTAVERRAAEELKKGVARLGAVADFDFIIRSDPSLGEDGIAIETTDEGVVLSGHPVRGPVYAVNEYLERFCGVRWWTKDEAHYPRLERLPKPAKPYRYTPPFRFRETFYFDPLTDALFKTRMKTNCSSYTRYILPPAKEAPIPAELGGDHRLVFFPGRRSAFHSFFQVIPPAKYFGEHPDWFSLVNGRRTAYTGEAGYTTQAGPRPKRGGQLCLTNEEMFREYVKETKRLLRENPGCDSVQVSQNDWERDWCECDRCKAVYDREGAVSGLYLDFANRVAAELEKDFPGVVVDTFAYTFTRKAPKTVRPRHNVLVRLCDFECGFNRPLASSPEEYEANRAFMRDLADWSKVAKGNLFIWDYQADFWSYILPHPNLHVFGPNLRTFAASGAVGIFEQGDGMCRAGDFAALKQWVTAHLVWDPSLDGGQLADEFLRGYYGGAAPYLKRVLQLGQMSASRPDAPSMRMYHREARPWITGECFRAVKPLLAEAAAAVADDPVLAYRVRTAALPWEHAEILNWKEWNGGSEAARQEALRRWTDALRERGVNTHRETVDPAAFGKYLEELGRVD